MGKIVTWEEPPATQSGRQVSSEELEAAAELAANPERWARLFNYTDSKKAASTAQTIRSGKRGAFSKVVGELGKGRFDAVSRQIPNSNQDPVYGVYVRYTLTDQSKRKSRKTSSEKHDPKHDPKAVPAPQPVEDRELETV